MVVSKLSNGECFLLKASESHFYLPLAVSSSLESISKVIKVHEFYHFML